MKRQLNQYLTGILAIIVAALVFVSCEENRITSIDTNTTESLDFKGTWLQLTPNGEETEKRILDFSDGYGTLIYLDQTGECNGKPELMKRFSWREVAEGAQILELNVFRHVECGVERENPYKELAYYRNSGRTLRIFSYSWIREPKNNDLIIKYNLQ